MLCSDKITQNLKVTLENDFRAVKNWIKLNKLTLNYKKSNCIVFTQNNCNTYNDFCLLTSNGTIPAKNVVKYLGIFIDSKLTWEYHTQFVVDKLCMANGILSMLKSLCVHICFKKCLL